MGNSRGVLLGFGWWYPLAIGLVWFPIGKGFRLLLFYWFPRPGVLVFWRRYFSLFPGVDFGWSLVFSFWFFGGSGASLNKFSIMEKTFINGLVNSLVPGYSPLESSKVPVLGGYPGWPRKGFGGLERGPNFWLPTFPMAKGVF